MVSLATPSKGGETRPASGAGGSGRGVITGKYFNFRPLPPPIDVLGNPLVVPNLPTHKLPRQSFGDRLARTLSRFGLGSQSADTKLRWKLHDTIQATMASLSPAVTALAERRAPLKRKSLPVPVVVVRHPYHLRHVFELLPQIPATLALERRFLELLMTRALKRYGEQMSLTKGSPFSFEHEAREYFFAGFRLEKQLKKVNSPDERFATLQAIHTHYFHGRNYYYYALLRRERLDPDNKLFMLFARAIYFMARVDWNGELLDKPSPRGMPNRDELLFFVERDKSVMTRYRSDQDFQRQVKAVLEAFPAA
ncbi:hypothetical protein [Azospirillum doebereinerae]|uniref:hypothetical protein n=1 Tax=Azospirillum doebereinerae TaxID=92933 RepID=UPI00163B899D|nr:hypothetical protein [Azospirillum doebereinerae]MCG5242106.1 hypothetical protein [Azospirillum doebereinerae]